MISVDKPMPKDCTECPFMYDYIYCNAAEESFCERNYDIVTERKRPDWCPLIEEKEYEPFYQYSEHTGSKWICCGNCDEPMVIAKSSIKPNYCSKCGKKVKWDD